MSQSHRHLLPGFVQVSQRVLQQALVLAVLGGQSLGLHLETSAPVDGFIRLTEPTLATTPGEPIRKLPAPVSTATHLEPGNFGLVHV